MTKLILVEGIPGAGKTTTANKIKSELELQGKEVTIYEEGTSHPADMAWNAYLTIEELDNFIKNCCNLWKKNEKLNEKNINSAEDAKINVRNINLAEDAKLNERNINPDKVQGSKKELVKRIMEQVQFEENHAILAYTRIDFPEEMYWSLISEVACKELCDGRSTLEDFTQIHLRRWCNFAEKAAKSDTITIFECAFLQNHIFELMAIYEKTDDKILEYIEQLFQTVKELNPKIIYLKPANVEDVIRHVAKERIAPQGSGRKDWIVEIAEWVERSNYGKSHGLHGVTGVVAFCTERLRLDLLVLSRLNAKIDVIERGNNKKIECLLE